MLDNHSHLRAACFCFYQELPPLEGLAENLVRTSVAGSWKEEDLEEDVQS